MWYVQPSMLSPRIRSRAREGASARLGLQSAANPMPVRGVALQRFFGGLRVFGFGILGFRALGG